MSLSRILLIIFNFLFVLLGIASLGLGIFVLTGKNYVLSILSKLPTGAGVADIQKSIDLPSLLHNSAYALLAVGGFIFIVGFLGCCGAWKESKFFLGLYVLIVFAIFVIQIAAAVMALIYKDKVESVMKEYLVKTIHEKYKDGVRYLNGMLKLSSDPITLAWDLAQVSLQCCGAHNSSDYATSTSWNSRYNITINNMTTSVNSKVALSCCKLKDPSAFPSKLAEIQFVDIGDCAQTGSMNSTNTGGCYDALKQLIMKYTYICIGIGVGVALVEIIGIVAACLLIRDIGKEADY